MSINKMRMPTTTVQMQLRLNCGVRRAAIQETKIRKGYFLKRLPFFVIKPAVKKHLKSISSSKSHSWDVATTANIKLSYKKKNTEKRKIPIFSEIPLFNAVLAANQWHFGEDVNLKYVFTIGFITKTIADISFSWFFF